MSFLVLQAYLKLIHFDLYLARKDFATLYNKVRQYPIANTWEKIVQAYVPKAYPNMKLDGVITETGAGDHAIISRRGRARPGDADRSRELAERPGWAWLLPFRRLDDIEFRVYDGMPHNICDAVPDRCAEDVRDFLRRRFGD